MNNRKKGSCHCGKVQFEVRLQSNLDNPRRCNCSLCRRKGAIMADIDPADIVILTGHDVLTKYQWNTYIAEHWFCSVCGIYTHHKKRGTSGGYGFNVACVEDIDTSSLDNVPIANGASMSLIDANEEH